MLERPYQKSNSFFYGCVILLHILFNTTWSSRSSYILYILYLCNKWKEFSYMYKPHRWYNGQHAGLECGRSGFERDRGKPKLVFATSPQCVRVERLVYLQTVVSVSQHYTSCTCRYPTKHVGYAQIRHHHMEMRLRIIIMVFNATFNNISVILWRSDLLMEETRENHPTCPKSMTNFIT